LLAHCCALLRPLRGGHFLQLLVHQFPFMNSLFRRHGFHALYALQKRQSVNFACARNGGRLSAGQRRSIGSQRVQAENREDAGSNCKQPFGERRCSA
jgi:hypothetical protein